MAIPVLGPFCDRIIRFGFCFVFFKLVCYRLVGVPYYFGNYPLDRFVVCKYFLPPHSLPSLYGLSCLPCGSSLVGCTLSLPIFAFAAGTLPIQSTDVQQGCRGHIMGKGCLPSKWCWENRISTRRKMNLDVCTTHRSTRNGSKTQRLSGWKYYLLLITITLK